MENWERIFPICHAALGEDYGDEVDAGRAEEREGGRFGEQLDTGYQ